MGPASNMFLTYFLHFVYKFESTDLLNFGLDFSSAELSKLSAQTKLTSKKVMWKALFQKQNLKFGLVLASRTVWSSYYFF